MERIQDVSPYSKSNTAGKRMQPRETQQECAFKYFP